MSPNLDTKQGLRAEDKLTEFESGNGLQPNTSIEQASLAELDDSRNGQFQRSFTPRQIHVSSASPWSSLLWCHSDMDLTLIFPDNLPRFQYR
jgi:hypothetical protein